MPRRTSRLLRLNYCLVKVEIMPWMRHVPSVLAPWKRAAEESYKAYNQLFHDYFDRVRKAVV